MSNKKLIPKKIHYCWLSGKKIPKHLKQCMDSWREQMPEYELVLWDTDRFDITTNDFVYEAFKAKKWAFAADYIRLYALYREGGIYLDVDVMVKKPFDNLLGESFFSSVEYHHHVVRRENSMRLINEDGKIKRPFSLIPGIGMQAAVMGSIKGHPFLKDCLEYYENRRFFLNNGELNKRILAPAIYSMTAERYGFRYIDKKQFLANGMLILPSVAFAGSLNQARDDSYAIHICNGSWRVPNEHFLSRFVQKTKLIFFSENTKMRLKRFRNELKGYSRDSEEVFTEIYRKKEQLYFSSNKFIDPNVEVYKKVLKEFIEDYNIKSIFEIGCGDYRIMKSVLSDSDIDYIGSDVVEDLIKHLSDIYDNGRRKFVHLDATNSNSLPDANLCIIYQVLQHLSNRQILKIIKKTRKYKYVIITELLPINPTSINVDKVTGLGIRMVKHQRSGVYLDSPPFSLKSKTLLSYTSDHKDIPAVMKTVLVENG